jgi:hypothetical protein
MKMFPIGTHVTVTSGPYEGKKGKVINYFALGATEDVAHDILVDEPFTVKDNIAIEAPDHNTGGMRKIHDPRPDLTIHRIEVPASCLQ